MTLTRPRDSAAEAFSRREAAGPTRCGRSSGLIAWTAVAAGLAAAALIFYWPVTIGGGIFTDYDLLVYFYPQQQYLGEQLRRGSLPLWNPYLFGGVPFLANIQTGVFYPPNWITAVLPPPYATTALTLFHAWLAAAGLVVLGRQLLGLGWAGALAAGVTFAFGGFLTQQASHPNQLATAAWLPWLLVLYDRARRPGGRLWLLPGCLAVAALICAGHSQEAYYSLLAVGVYGLWCAVSAARGARQPAVGVAPEAPGSPATIPLMGRRHRLLAPRSLASLARCLLPYALLVGGGLALAAVQILPTAELSRRGMRAAGLSFQDAVTFSLPPWLLPQSLLPFATDRLPTQEYVGYVGLTGLAAAIYGLFGSRHPLRIYFAVIAGAGLLLALGGYDPLYGLIYRIVPGVGLFRVPARWLFWVAFGVAALAGIGVDRLVARGRSRPVPRARRAVLIGGSALAALLLALAPTAEVALGWVLLTVGTVAWMWRPRRSVPPAVWPVVGAIVLAGELWLAGRPLVSRQVTHPQAWFSVRPAIAQVLIDTDVYRVLSVSASTFEPGDRAELAQTYRDSLGANGLRDLFVTLKLREILSPNIPLAYQRATLDGYDGGILPLRDYVALKNALIDAARPEEGSRLVPPDYQPDGLLIRQLGAIPPTDLLSALNVKYVVTDKSLDPWVDGVYYDLGLTARVRPGERWEIPVRSDLTATGVGIVSYLEGAGDVPGGTVIGTVHLTGADGRTVSHPLRAGDQTAED